MSSNTLSVMTSQLGHIFRGYGRGNSWNVQSNKGNPIYSPEVKEYILAVNEEQAIARILPKQSKPIFLGKLKSISSFINDQLENKDFTLSLREKYTLLRDQALLKLQFFSGDRASDVSNILSQEMRTLPDKSGYVFKHTYGKTLRGGNGKCNTFVIKRCDDTLICPIYALEYYFAQSAKFGLDLSSGYAFRLVTEQGKVLDDAISYSAIYERLKYYLQILGIDEGETPHSLRAGCAITLALSSDTRDDIMSHVGWSSSKMADYYSRATQLKDACSVAQHLSVADKNNIEAIYAEYGQFTELSNPF